MALFLGLSTFGACLISFCLGVYCGGMIEKRLNPFEELQKRFKKKRGAILSPSREDKPPRAAIFSPVGKQKADQFMQSLPSEEDL